MLLALDDFSLSQTSNVKTSVSRKQCTPNFPKNEHFFPPDTQTYVSVSWGKKRSFFQKFGVLCFLETPVLRFFLLPYHRRLFLEFFLVIFHHQHRHEHSCIHNHVLTYFKWEVFIWSKFNRVKFLFRVGFKVILIGNLCKKDFHRV